MTAATLSAASRRGRFTGWFGANPPAGTTEAGRRAPAQLGDGDARMLVERRQYDEIGDFLFRHRLAPTPTHYEIAHAYLSGADQRIGTQIGTMLAAGGTLDAAAFAALAAPVRMGELLPQTLAMLADQLHARLSECQTAADRSHSSARDYGEALDVAQTRLADDPMGTIEHIAGLTREVLATSRMIEDELRQTRRETERLRGDLDRARDAAERDHLTGLPNRRGFERRVADLLEGGGDGAHRRLTVALCDIDDFKRVNDVHGHQTGDRVLRFVGTFLANQLGKNACVARYGGEEFAVLVEGASLHEAVSMLDDARERLAARSLVNQDTGAPLGRITFSAGAAVLTDDAARALGAADAALYRAKGEGKNAVQIAAG